MNFKDVEIKLKQLVDGLIDRQVLGEIGKEVKEAVITRTRKGFGVPQNLAPQERLKGLSPNYKKKRRKLKERGKLSTKTAPNKSNLTKSGEMLDTTKVTVQTNSVTIGPNGSDNQKKANLQAREGRNAYNLSKSENAKLLKEIEKKIINDIKKIGL